MTSKEGEALQELRQIKVNLFECYIAETRFATFLMKCLERYRSGLSSDETFKTKWFSDRIYDILQKLKASGENSRGILLDENCKELQHTTATSIPCDGKLTEPRIIAKNGTRQIVSV